MPEQNQTQQSQSTQTPQPIAEQESAPVEQRPTNNIGNKVAEKINEAHNILIALSSDPSVDEIAAAIGLSLHLDRMGKRATAIYSGHAPNALEFLNPEETFETSTDALQDFVIALNKEKADHLRYKLDGDYVKIFITPYRSRIAEEDLDFSYGDYNVDLVISLGVDNGIDLDDALREHGRIMHDASIINITTGNPGKFGEIEWSDKRASSVSEMLSKMLYDIDSEVKIDPDEATAFLTGIVAATDRFSRANTTADCMELASRLMDSGAKHQLISKNITEDIENKFYGSESKKSPANDAENAPVSEPEKEEIKESPDSEPTSSKETTDINHSDDAEPIPEDKSEEAATEEPEPESESNPTEDSSLLEELRNAEANLASTGAEVVPEATNEPVRLDESTQPTTPVAPEPLGLISDAEPPAPTTTPTSAPEPAPMSTPTLPPVQPQMGNNKEKVVAPSADFSVSSLAEGTNKYGKMLEDALNESTPAPAAQPQPIATAPNPAASSTPAVASAPEINGVPEINYAPLPGDEVLPPPPAPPIDFGAPMPGQQTVTPASPMSTVSELPPAPSTPAANLPEPPVPNVPTSPLEPVAPTATAPTPAQELPIPTEAQAPAPTTPAAPAPDAFKIPGM